MEAPTRTLLIALGVLLVAVIGFPMLMGGMMGPAFLMPGPGATGMPGRQWMWTMMGTGLLGVLLWIALLVVVAFVVVRALGTASTRPGPDTPLDILKRRYAAGEITREQYEQMRRDLQA